VVLQLHSYKNALLLSRHHRLQPVVLQLHSYKNALLILRTPPASAGGTSTSQLQERLTYSQDTTGFSRWYFNFIATRTPYCFQDTTGFSRWYFNFIAKRTPYLFSGHHRASAGGVPCLVVSTVAAKLKYHRLQPVVSNVWWCLNLQRNIAVLLWWVRVALIFQ
jgi:hypothetical protein